jgi:t-SNARE complex subunit (syntaxin)
VADEPVIKLLEEIRDLQKEHIASYKEAVKNQNEAIALQKGAARRQKLAILVIVAAVVIMLLCTVLFSHH